VIRSTPFDATPAELIRAAKELQLEGANAKDCREDSKKERKADSYGRWHIRCEGKVSNLNDSRRLSALRSRRTIRRITDASRNFAPAARQLTGNVRILNRYPESQGHQNND
jgi:hypothetical protein